jgi:hypothetical protein
MKYFTKRWSVSKPPQSFMARIFAVLCATAVVSYGQEPVRITFDAPPPQPPGTARFIQEYYESGMLFRPVGSPDSGNGFVRVGSNPVPGRPDNGSGYFQAAQGDSLAFSFVNDSVFDLRSVDLAEYSAVVPDAVTVLFFGYRQDGSRVETYFTTDGIIDGIGPMADFQTFYFGPEFSGLTRVEIPTHGWSLDNLVVTIPEPSTNFLLAAGALTLWSLHRRRQKR